MLADAAHILRVKRKLLQSYVAETQATVKPAAGPSPQLGQLPAGAHAQQSGEPSAVADAQSEEAWEGCPRLQGKQGQKRKQLAGAIVKCRPLGSGWQCVRRVFNRVANCMPVWSRSFTLV
jgi:GAF domain-containing protein